MQLQIKIYSVVLVVCGRLVWACTVVRYTTILRVIQQQV